MATSSAERGAPVDREHRRARGTIPAVFRRGRARPHPVESSPLGGDRVAARTAPAWPARAAVLLAVAGALCLAAAFHLQAKAVLGQALLHAAWTRMQQTGAPAKPWPWADTHPLARLYAPAQGEDLLVLEGASGRTLAWGPGHLDGSARPGEPGNAVLSAHRDTHFRFLERVRVGETLEVEAPDGRRLRYRVRETVIGDAATLAFPRDTDVPTLTLVTCYPFDALVPGGPLRYAVIAEAD